MLASRIRWIGAVVAAAAFGIAGAYAAQVKMTGSAQMEPVNKLPNPYKSVANWAKFPNGRQWGSTAGVDIAPDGKTVWAVDRCGSNTCVGSDLDPILKFDTNGKLLFSFGKGLFAFPHGIHVDSEENIWVTDVVLGDGRGKGATVGQTVQKFDKNGKHLMTLGTPGVSGNDQTHFNAPSDVVVAPNGDVFVSDGHGTGTNERIVKFDKTGKFIKAWGHPGSGPGAFSSLHALEMDSRGRLFVGNRDNNRIDIFDQDGNLLESWYQFSRPAGIYIDPATDTMYVTDSESGSVSESHQDWTRGIRVGSAKDGSVKYLIPDPDVNAKGTSISEGVAADKDGVIYGAEVGPKRMMRYTSK
jgi:DNA-binding beta-propeller fold protein YncE